MKHSNLYLGLVLPSGGWQSLIRHLWQLKTVVFLHWCLKCAVMLQIWSHFVVLLKSNLDVQQTGLITSGLGRANVSILWFGFISSNDHVQMSTAWRPYQIVTRIEKQVFIVRDRVRSVKFNVVGNFLWWVFSLITHTQTEELALADVSQRVSLILVDK